MQKHVCMQVNKRMIGYLRDDSDTASHQGHGMSKK